MDPWEIRWADYYLTLGLPPDASEAQIKEAQTDLAQVLHPDHTIGRPERARLRAEEELKRVNQAGDVLRDPVVRARYDKAYRQHESNKGPERKAAEEPVKPPQLRITNHDITLENVDPLAPVRFRISLEQASGQPFDPRFHFIELSPRDLWSGARIWLKDQAITLPTELEIEVDSSPQGLPQGAAYHGIIGLTVSSTHPATSGQTTSDLLTLTVTTAAEPPPKAVISRGAFIKGIGAFVAVGGAYLLLNRDSGSSETALSKLDSQLTPLASNNQVAAPSAPQAPLVQAQPSPVPPTPVPPAPGTVLYQADWSAGDGGWKFPDQWGLINGVLNTGERAAQTVYSPFKPTSADYAAEVEMQWITNYLNYGFVVIRDSYLFKFQTVGAGFGPVTGEILTTGKTLGSGPIPNLDTSRHVIRFEGKGKVLTAFIDGKQVLQVVGDNDYKPGLSGINSGFKMLFRGFRIIAT